MSCPLERMARDHERDALIMRVCLSKRYHANRGDKIYSFAAWGMSVPEFNEVSAPFPLLDKWRGR